MHREVDDDADVRHARRERADPGNGDREDVLAAQRVLDRLHGGIEALDMADHQGHAGPARRRDDGVAFLDRRRDRLFDQHVNAARDAGQRQIAVQVRGRGDGDGVDAVREQALHIGIADTAERA